MSNTDFTPTEMKIKITLIDPQLGTTSNNPELRREFIMKKNPNGVDEEEDEGFDADAELEKDMTVFPRLPDGRPFVFDYMIRGFFKDAQGALNRMPDRKMSAYKRVIDGLVFVKERKIPITLPKGGEMSVCNRPLRTSGPKGERTALASSEQVPAGSTMELTVQVLDAKLLNTVISWLNYGRFKGLGQWRNSGKGRFTWEELVDEDAKPKRPKIVIKTKSTKKTTKAKKK